MVSAHWPWVLLNIHLLSGLVLLPLIHHFRSKHGSQWKKFLVYFLLINGIWALTGFLPGSIPWLGYGLAAACSLEFLQSMIRKGKADSGSPRRSAPGLQPGSLSGSVTHYTQGSLLRSGPGSVRHCGPGSLLRSGLSILVLLAVLAAFIYFVHEGAAGWFYCFYLVVIFDATAQVGGQLLGRRKLFAAISPSKTVEGLLSALLITLASSLLVRQQLLGEEGSWALLSLSILAAATAGDLLASWHKRRCGIKNYSNFIPGHGGFLDRFDSLLMAGALMGLYALLGIL